MYCIQHVHLIFAYTDKNKKKFEYTQSAVPAVVLYMPTHVLVNVSPISPTFSHHSRAILQFLFVIMFYFHLQCGQG